MTTVVEYALCVYGIWILFGSLTGGIVAVSRKWEAMDKEPPKKKRLDQYFVEASADAVYDMSRLCAHAGMGTACGGIFAAGFPFTMMIYRSLYAGENRPV